MADEPIKNGRELASGRFVKGWAGGPGAPRGTHRLNMAALVNDVIEAYKVKGGIEYLRGLSDTLFVGLLQKLLPLLVDHDVRVEAKPLRILMIEKPDDVGATAEPESEQA